MRELMLDRLEIEALECILVGRLKRIWCSNLRSDSVLVRGDRDSGRDGTAGEKTSQSSWCNSSYGILEALNCSDVGGQDSGELVASGRVDRCGDGLSSKESLEHVSGKVLALVVDVNTSESKGCVICNLFSMTSKMVVRLELHTSRYDQVLGSVSAEDGVALEESDGLVASVGDGNLGDVINSVGDLNSKRAYSSQSCASKGHNREESGNHIET